MKPQPNKNQNEPLLANIGFRFVDLHPETYFQQMDKEVGHHRSGGGWIFFQFWQVIIKGSCFFNWVGVNEGSLLGDDDLNGVNAATINLLFFLISDETQEGKVRSIPLYLDISTNQYFLVRQDSSTYCTFCFFSS